MHKAFSRRTTLLGVFQTVSIAAMFPLFAQRARSAESCINPASDSLRASLHYTDPSPEPEKSCGMCGFFMTDQQSKMSCGNCQIMAGPVHATSRCDSWSPKS